MQTILTSLSNPRWANGEHTVIDCEITTSQFGNEVLPFSADANDVAPHGLAIFADLVAGKYGIIAEYLPARAAEEPTPPANGVPQSIL